MTDVEQWEHDEQRAMENEIERLRGIVVECRSSVKFDLTHYEKMARAYGNLGPEGVQTHETAEAEAQRLHELLAKIDALALTPPNAKVRGPEAALSPEAPSRLPGYAGAAKDEKC